MKHLLSVACHGPHEPRGSQPHPRGTGRNPATSTHQTGWDQLTVAHRIDSGEAEQ
jgi:hypothetical protein